MVYRILCIFFFGTLMACHPSGTKVTVPSDVTSLSSADSAEFLSMSPSTKWHSYGKDKLGSAWKTSDNTLHLDASVKEGWQTKNGGDIVTNEEFADFDLSLDWKIATAGNSGIIFFVHEDTSKYHYAWETGPEMQVVDNEGDADGKNAITRAGSMYDLVAVSKDVFKPAGEWNHVEITCRNGDLVFHANGEQVLHETLWDDAWKKLIAQSKFHEMKDFGTFRKGKICLQDHGADVWYRNIRIRRL